MVQGSRDKRRYSGRYAIFYVALCGYVGERKRKKLRTFSRESVKGIGSASFLAHSYLLEPFRSAGRIPSIPPPIRVNFSVKKSVYVL